MNFEYTEEQVMLRDSIAKWAAGSYDFDKRRVAISDPEVWKVNWATFAEFGLLAAPFPEQYGGLGGTPLDVAVIMEEFGKALVVEPYLPTVVLGGGALMHAGTEEQKAQHLGDIASGMATIAFAQAEPKSRFTLHDVATQAKKAGSGFVLNGHKSVVIGAPQANYLLVSARTGGSQREAKGISLFLIPRTFPGIVTRDYPTVDAFRASEVFFENVSVGLEHLIGAEGEALPLIERIVDEGIAALCSEAVGVLRTTHALTLEYARTRKQFGRAIGEFQVLQHRMVDMFMEVEESVSMALLATLKLDAPPLERAKAVSSAKSRIGRAQRFVGQSAIQIHGGMGVTDEMRISHYFKRLAMIDVQFGDADHHLNRYMRLSRQAA